MNLNLPYKSSTDLQFNQGLEGAKLAYQAQKRELAKCHELISTLQNKNELSQLQSREKDELISTQQNKIEMLQLQSEFRRSSEQENRELFSEVQRLRQEISEVQHLRQEIERLKDEGDHQRQKYETTIHNLEIERNKANHIIKDLWKRLKSKHTTVPRTV